MTYARTVPSSAWPPNALIYNGNSCRPGRRCAWRAIPAGRIKRLVNGWRQILPGRRLDWLSPPCASTTPHEQAQSARRGAAGRSGRARLSHRRRGAGPAGSAATAQPRAAHRHRRAAGAAGGRGSAARSRRSSVRRGNQLLDTLESIKADLLSAGVARAGSTS